MRLYSTSHATPFTTLQEATFRSLAPDKGLYMPEFLPKLPDSFWDKIGDMTFAEIAFEVSSHIFTDAVPADKLKAICEDAFNFDVPAVEVEPDTYCLELFHGPSYAFKDFGARFMSRLMAYFLEKSEQEINVLVATSGDTGGAVALGFLGTPHIHVTILYPSGKVSLLQEKQLTTLGHNIQALEVQGTFDDCQHLVKSAFADKALNEKLYLTSANSINISRLLPQSFYYFWAYKQLRHTGKPLVFSVPSGNFGNICAGLIAKRLGLPVGHFVAATNANDVFPKYHQTGEFIPKPSVRTISNAMDVGNPSNFARISELYGADVEKIRADIDAYSFSDEESTAAIIEMFEKDGYISEPHAAIGYLGLKAYKETHNAPFTGVFLGTAHPVKFADVLPVAVADKVEVPQPLQEALQKEKQAIVIPPDYEALKAYLLQSAVK